MKKLPRLYIAISCYRQENYIEECLIHLLAQQGNFTAEVHIFDDASPDGTREKIESLLRTAGNHPFMTFHLEYNQSNIGMAENTKQILRALRASSSDYCCILEGDDYWISPFYLKRHIDILEDHPEYTMSNNQLLFLQENNPGFEFPCFRMREYPIQVHNAAAITAEMQAYDNYSGNFSSNVYRTSILQKLPEDFLNLPYVDDWFVNLLMAQYGAIGSLKEPLSVYRIHADGVWSGRKEQKKTSYVENNIWKRMRYIRTHYDNPYWEQFAHFSQLYAHLPMSGKLYYHARGEIFSEKQWLPVYYAFSDATHFQVEVDLSSLPDRVQALRFDPCEGWMVRTRELKVLINGKQCLLKPELAREEEDGTIFFPTIDPIIYLTPKLSPFDHRLKTLSANGEIWFYKDEKERVLR